MSKAFKVGEKVRLTGRGWDGSSDFPAKGTVVTIVAARPEFYEHEDGYFEIPGYGGDSDGRFFAETDPQGYWAAEPVEAEVPGANNYEQVEGLKPGTIFQFGGGAPWLRTEGGLRDLLVAYVFPNDRADRSYPIAEYENWRELRHKITVLYTPDED